MGRLSWMISCVVIRILLRGRQASQGRRCDTHKSQSGKECRQTLEQGFPTRAVDHDWSSGCWRPGCTADGEWQVSEGRFVCCSWSFPIARITTWTMTPTPSPHTPTLVVRGKNCLPQNWSLLPKMLGTAALADRKREEINSPLESSGRPQPCWPVLDFWTSKLFSNTLV